MAAYVGVWREGFKFAAPWYTVSHLLPQQSIIYDTPVKECPTRDNVMVTIDVTLILRIKTEDENACYNFCYGLGARGLDNHLRAFQEESIRAMVRTRKYNEIYDLINAHQDKQFIKLKRELNEHFNKFGVIITEISVKNVHLPKEFADSMQEATVWRCRNKYQSLKQEYAIRKIEISQNELDEKSNTDEQMDNFIADKDTELAELVKKKKLVYAETSKQLAQIKEEQDADVLQIKANSELIVAELNKQTDIQKSKIESVGISEADKIKIETNVYIQTIKASADAEIAKNDGMSLQLKAKAEKYAANELIAKRLYEQKMRSLQMLRGLSTNCDVVVAGNCNDNITAQMVANQKGGVVLGIDR
eukprot:89639_1